MTHTYRDYLKTNPSCDELVAVLGRGWAICRKTPRNLARYAKCLTPKEYEAACGEAIKLRAGRCCLYWPRENKGFIGLASDGPADGARVGPAADITLREITSVIECTPAAAKKWEASPWR